MSLFSRSSQPQTTDLEPQPGGMQELAQTALDKLKKAAVRQIADMRALQPKLTDKREERTLLEAIEEAEVAIRGGGTVFLR
jgi:hypothetical protein